MDRVSHARLRSGTHRRTSYLSNRRARLGVQSSERRLTGEEATSRGRLDLAVRLGTSVYLFEFKVAERSAAGAALAQLQARGYADKHRAPGRAVHLIGVEISAESRDVVAFDAITCPGERSERSPGA